MDQPTRARRLWVLTSEQFDFPTRLPANVRYAGPVLDDPNWTTDDWTLPPGDDALVLVGLSSTTRTTSPPCNTSSTPWRHFPSAPS